MRICLFLECYLFATAKKIKQSFTHESRGVVNATLRVLSFKFNLLIFHNKFGFIQYFNSMILIICNININSGPDKDSVLTLDPARPEHVLPGAGVAPHGERPLPAGGAAHAQLAPPQAAARPAAEHVETGLDRRAAGCGIC